jgi:uncharacterized protein (TIGR03067 family)
MSSALLAASFAAVLHAHGPLPTMAKLTGQLQSPGRALRGDEKPADAAKDEKRFEGEWAVVSQKYKGKDVDPAELKDMRFVFKGKTVALIDRGVRANWTIDPTKNPKHLDLVYTDPEPVEGLTVHGVYEFEGDTLRICFDADKLRPGKVESPIGSNTILHVLKRVKKDR